MSKETVAQLERLQDDPQYQGAMAKLQELESRRRELVLAIEAKRNAKENIEDTAKKFLATGEMPISLDDELERLHKEKRIVDRAIAIQQQDVSEIMRRVSERLCKQAEPAAIRLQENIVRAMKTLHAAIADQENFYNNTRQAGVRRTSFPTAWNRRQLENLILNGYSGYLQDVENLWKIKF